MTMTDLAESFGKVSATQMLLVAEQVKRYWVQFDGGNGKWVTVAHFDRVTEAAPVYRNMTLEFGQSKRIFDSERKLPFFHAVHTWPPLSA